MPSLKYAIPSDSTIVDSATNKVSLINLIEDVFIPREAPLPLIIPQTMFITSLWVKSSEIGVDQPEYFKYKILFRLPSGTEFPLGDEIDSVIPENKTRLRTVLGIGGIKIDELGRHNIIVKLLEGETWQEKYSYAYDVKQVG